MYQILEVGDKADAFIRKNLYLCLLGLSVAALLFGRFVVRNSAEAGVGEGVVLEASALSSDTASDSGEITAYISGAVQDPGVYELPSGSRVVDLLGASKGLTNDVSAEWVSQKLNLARPLENSQKIYVPFEWEIELVKADSAVVPLLLEEVSGADVSDEGSVASGSNDSSSDNGGGSSTDLINVNTASQEALEGLNGVGPVTATKIIDNRSYKDFAELKEKASLSDGLIAKIQDFVTF